MHQDAESLCGPVFARECDPRVTKVGNIIRKMRLDEVPQFINIFKGDMDLVGPRDRSVLSSSANSSRQHPTITCGTPCGPV